MPFELPPEIKKINRQLESHFGISTDDMCPMWRVSWSEDQYEKRKSDVTASGIQLLSPEVIEFKKYSYIKDRFILENWVIVPEQQQNELLGVKKSYECMWNFSGRNGEAVQPTFDACKFIIDAVYAVKGKSSLRKYVESEEEGNTPEAIEKRTDKLVEELFGDESGLLLRTVTGEASVVPANYGDGTIK